MSDPIRDYLNQCGRVPLLTAAEEIELGHAVQAMIRLQTKAEEENRTEFTSKERSTIRRGERAKKRMIEANLRLVVTVAMKYKHWTSSLDMLDLIQEGNIGLVRAVELFDPERGYKFSTYAFWWIRQGVTRSTLSSDRLIRLPAAASEALRKLRYWRTEFETKNFRPPTIDECAEYIGCTPKTMRDYLVHPTDCLSLDYRVSDNGKEASCLVDLIPDSTYVPDTEIEMEVRRMEDALTYLDEPQKTMVKLRYGLEHGEPLSYVSIAKELGITRDAVEKGLRKAMMRLRTHMAKTPGKQSLQKRSSSLNWSLDRAA